MKKISTQKGNGATAGHDYPVKSHTKSSINFIAYVGRIKSALIRFASWLAVVFRGFA
mgnify:CR=1 FL=1